MEAFDLQTLSINLLHSKAQADLLDHLEELRGLGFRRRISPPQLVLCGDQNNGKSAVFEAITGVSLPINNAICTRFATEVIFRRSAHRSAHVRIRPSSTASPDHQRKLGAFSRPHNWLRDVAKLFSEARLIMGLAQGGSYSQDALQLEISGPTLPDLTVVDLPGLLQSPSRPNQTSDDVHTVHELTEFYMTNPRNIVLAVVSAEYLLSQQAILHAISSCATRAMGIMTKPDLFEPGSVGEDSFYARLKNQDTPLKLGWHMLRNLDTNERKLAGLTRDDIESMFISSTSPWKDVSPAVVGIDALRNRLSKIILGQVELQRTGLASEIQKDLETNKTSLERLGTFKNSSAERRLFLIRIGQRFTSLTKAATSGKYEDIYFRSPSTRRLRSVIWNWEESFAADMEERGHSYRIMNDYTNGTSQSPRDRQSPEDPRPVTRSEFISDLAEFLKQSKGQGSSGLANAQIIGELFVRYSIKWSSMAKAHVFEAWKKVKQFLDDLLHYIAGASVGAAILRGILNHDMEGKLQKLYQKVEELIVPYNKALPSTINRQLNSKIRQLRRGSHGLQENDEHSELKLCSELLDCMLAYYSIALGVFVDNIANLAVEVCLINGLDDLISPSRIIQMPDEEIDRLTASSEDIELSRNHLSKRIKVLEIAAAACAKCEMNAIESASQNYTSATTTTTTATATTDKRTTNHSSMAIVVSDTSTASLPMSPGTPDTDISTPVSRVTSTSRSTKGTRQPSVFRAFPLPTRPHPPNSPLPQPPRASTSTGQHNMNLIPTSSTTTTDIPPAPRIPSRSQSLASSSNSDRSAMTTKSSKIVKQRSTKMKPVGDDRPSAWMTMAMFKPVCKFCVQIFTLL